MEAQFPELEPSEESLEGTAAHSVFPVILQQGEEAVQVDTLAPNGVLITEEMLAGALLLIADIESVCGADLDAANSLMIEQKAISCVIHQHNWGTPDASLYLPKHKKLYVWDYKFGHEYVDVKANLQLINYAALLIDILGINGHDDQNIQVIFRIVQPRCYHREGPLREWVVKASDLRSYVNFLRQSGEEAMGDNPRLISGNHCTHCRARHACPALRKAAMASIDYIDNSQIEILDNRSIGVEYRILKLARDRVVSRLQAIEADLYARIAGKQSVPGQALEATYGHKKWVCDVQEVLLLGDLMGVDLRKPEAAITPTQALAKKGIDASVIAAYINEPFTGLSLVEQTESHIADIFK